MTDRPQPTEPPPYWTRSASAMDWQSQNSTPLRRFIGGSPLAVVIKLAVVSIVVGMLLMWLQISPADVFAEAVELGRQLWALGFRSLHEFGTYLAAGAAIVLPVWIVIRLLSFRGR